MDDSSGYRLILKSGVNVRLQRGVLFVGMIYSFLVLLAPMDIHAQLANMTRTQLTESQLYRRCHFHLSGRPIPLNDSRLSSIESQQMTGLQACAEVLELGSLGANGRLNDSTNSMARAVLKTFLSFHKTWFRANTLEQIQDYSEDLGRGSNDVYDAAEPALTLTRNLLTNLPYREVLTSDQGVRLPLFTNDDSDAASSKRIHALFGNSPAPGNEFLVSIPSRSPRNYKHSL